MKTTKARRRYTAPIQCNRCTAHAISAVNGEGAQCMHKRTKGAAFCAQHELAAASARMLAGISLAEMQAGAAPYAQVNAWRSAAIAERDALRAENERLRTALERVVDATFEDAVNRNFHERQVISRDGIDALYETALAALAATGAR